VKFHLSNGREADDLFKEISMLLLRTYVLLALAAATLSACYVVPVKGADGSVVYQHYPLPPAGTPIAASPGAAMPAVISAKLYPANEQATQTGVVVGTVANMMTGKGQFQVNYMGEVLSGEATRVSTADRKGVASAFGPRGMYMSCEYQMNTPYQGAGSCTFSNGAKYQLHLGGN
jgi:hypothetical protein